MRRSEIRKQIDRLKVDIKQLTELWRNGEVETIDDCIDGDTCYYLYADTGTIGIEEAFFDSTKSPEAALLGLCFLTEADAIARKNELLSR